MCQEPIFGRPLAPSTIAQNDAIAANVAVDIVKRYFEHFMCTASNLDHVKMLFRALNVITRADSDYYRTKKNIEIEKLLVLVS